MATLDAAASSAAAYTYIMFHHTYTKKVKLSRYRPAQALGVPGG
jgi:hypothetical protein